MTTIGPPHGTPEDIESLEEMARVLTFSGDFRVLRKFRPRKTYSETRGRKLTRGLYIDLETTGLDPKADAIIELGIVPFDYSAEDCEICEVHGPFAHFEDPLRPIPDEIKALTGISNLDVAGKRIPDDVVEKLLAGVTLVIAHNAAFDRGFMERRFPGFNDLAWACSCTEVPWRDLGCRSSALEIVLMMGCAEFCIAHRATEDCLVGIHVLATKTKEGVIPFRLLLESAREPTIRIWALGSRIELKDLLKTRGYRWHPGDRDREKSWYCDVCEAGVDAECEWLAHNIYSGSRPQWKKEKFTAATRYSGRLGKFI